MICTLLTGLSSKEGTYQRNHVPFLFLKCRLVNTGRYFSAQKGDKSIWQTIIQKNSVCRSLRTNWNRDCKEYLRVMSKFHNYSFNNTMLIAMQKPDATLVAGYKAWQKNFERHVNKGEKAIRILAPAPYKIKEERDKIDPITQELLLDKDGNPQKEERTRS